MATDRPTEWNAIQTAAARAFQVSGTFHNSQSDSKQQQHQQQQRQRFITTKTMRYLWVSHKECKENTLPVSGLLPQPAPSVASSSFPAAAERSIRWITTDCRWGCSVLGRHDHTTHTLPLSSHRNSFFFNARGSWHFCKHSTHHSLSLVSPSSSSSVVSSSTFTALGL